METNSSLLPFVISAGLLNSFNPCAIAILLIFIAFMFTVRKSRRVILGMGSVYIISLFITYLAIGLGLLKIVQISNTPNLINKIGAVIVIFIGAWGLFSSIFKTKFHILAIPMKMRQIIANLATKVTVPAAIATGILVGVAEFPCAGAIYVATLTLLNAKTTFLTGLLYLILYNIMFVLPLVIILLVSTNRMVAERIINTDEANSPRIRVIIALVMIAIGLLILFKFS